MSKTFDPDIEVPLEVLELIRDEDLEHVANYTALTDDLTEVWTKDGNTVLIVQFKEDTFLCFAMLNSPQMMFLSTVSQAIRAESMPDPEARGFAANLIKNMFDSLPNYHPEPFPKGSRLSRS